MMSKGSIYAAAQQDGVPSRVLNGNGGMPADSSDPDAMSNASFDVSVSALVVVVACALCTTTRGNDLRLQKTRTEI